MDLANMENILRIFPTLTILENDLVKTLNYRNPRYLGDPINAIKLFNNKNVDEICILDISSRFSKKHKEINYQLLKEMAQEAFVPLSYGGNVLTSSIAEKIINLGFEKIIVNSLLFEDSSEVHRIVQKLGSQSVVLKVDYIIKDGFFHVSYNQRKSTMKLSYEELIKLIESSCVGEVIFSRTDLDGNMTHYDYKPLKHLLKKLSMPLVLCHGAKDKSSIIEANKEGFFNFTASSMFVYYGDLKGILINDPFFHL